MDTRETQKLAFESLPSFLPSYRRALLHFRKPNPESAEWPRIEAFVTDVGTDAALIARYRDVCRLSESIALPPVYPQVLAAPLHAAMLTAPQFPFRALGLIHVGNRMVEHRVIYENERLSFECAVDGYNTTAKGVAFEVTTKAFVGGETVWESVATLLTRQIRSEAVETRPPVVSEPARSSRLKPGAHVRLWSVPADMGRRYASVAGDYNPIHLHALTAKLFGLKQPIAHGLWTLSRSLGEMDAEMPRGARIIEVSFQKPVVLPSVVLFSRVRDKDGLQFSLLTVDGGKVYLQGSVRALTKDSAAVGMN